ncbi:MAG: EscU/YscU/HrcU family type III secretion system export apparatus switch protein [Kineosporiaceae bacterium]
MAQDGKTEKPTPRRLREARKRGQFPRTQDPATWLGIGAGTAMVPHAIGVLSDEVTRMLAGLPAVAADPSPARAVAAMAGLPQAVLTAAAPVDLAAGAAAVLAMAAQGVHVTAKTLAFKPSRLSPRQGLARMLGTRAAWEALKALIKVVIIAGVVLALARSLVPQLVGAGLSPLPTSLHTLGSGLHTLVWTAAATGLVLALADYAYQRRTVMKRLRMTPREIKDEQRQTEGDPMVKGAIRARQLAMSRNRMLAAVATADVVLVNPTHFAVALRYVAGRGAPRVVAKGADALAAKIREQARQHTIPVVEDKPLTRLLYRICDLDDEIPAELYMAVARILAFVFALRRPGSGVPRPEPSDGSRLPDLPTKVQLRVRRSRERREGRRETRGLLSAGGRRR